MLSCIPKNEKGNEVLAQLQSQYKGLQIEKHAPEEKGVCYKLKESLIGLMEHQYFQNILGHVVNSLG